MQMWLQRLHVGTDLGRWPHRACLDGRPVRSSGEGSRVKLGCRGAAARLMRNSRPKSLEKHEGQFALAAAEATGKEEGGYPLSRSISRGYPARARRHPILRTHVDALRFEAPSIHVTSRPWFSSTHGRGAAAPAPAHCSIPPLPVQGGGEALARVNLSV